MKKEEKKNNNIGLVLTIYTFFFYAVYTSIYIFFSYVI